MFQITAVPEDDWKWILGLTILMESITCLFRFGFGLESTRDTAFIGQLTYGWRIHHGYVGLVVAILACLWPEGHGLRHWCLRIGWSLVASDLIHHFLVLWPITGDPQFHIRYPRQ